MLAALMTFLIAYQAHGEWIWGGEMRIRGHTEKSGDNEARVMERLRLRLDVQAIIDEELRAELRLASGTSNRSANQTLGDSSAPGAPRRIFGLDLAYMEWKPAFFAKFDLGKIPQLHYRPGASSILLDENISLEGGGGVLDYTWLDTWRVALAGGSVIVRENYDTYYSVANSNNMINWAQVRGQWQAGRYRVTAGGGFFNYTSLKGKKFSDLVNGGTANGNTTSLTGTIANPYLAREYFMEGFIPLSAVDLSVFFERIENHETPDCNWAIWSGMSLAHKTWEAQVAYAEVKPDPVPALFTNADLAGGTTDARGWVITARWKASPNLNLKLWQFVNRIQASTVNKEYNKTYLDLSASF